MRSSIRAIVPLALSPLLLTLSCGDGTGVKGSSLTVVWTAPRLSGGGDWISGIPAVDGGRLFIQEGNTLAGLDAATGRRLWTRPIRVAPFPGPSTLRAGGGQVYVSETDSIMAVDAATGATIWNVHPDSQTVTETALDATTFYTGQRGIPVVYAVARGNGAVRWKKNVGTGYTLPAHVRGVTVSGDTVYASVERYLAPNGTPSSGVLVALDRTDGHELWRFETPSGKHYCLDAPVVAGPRILVNDVGTGDAVAVDIVTHAEVWRTKVGAAIKILTNGQLAYTGGNDHAFGLDLATGAVRWTSATGSSSFGIGLCQNYLFTSVFALRRFDGATGTLVGEVAQEGGYVSHVASDAVRAYATGAKGTVAVLCAPSS